MSAKRFFGTACVPLAVLLGDCVFRTLLEFLGRVGLGVRPLRIRTMAQPCRDPMLPRSCLPTAWC